MQVDSEIDAIPYTEGVVRPKRGGQCVQEDSQTQPSQDYETQDTQETQEEESQADRTGVGAGSRDRVHTPWPCATDHEGLLKVYMVCYRK